MNDWQRRIDEVWDWAAGHPVDDEIVARIDAIAAERGDDDPCAAFERAGARDSVGREAEAVALYRRALELGLDEDRRTQATIQLASTLRNLGELDAALALIAVEQERHGDGPYRDAIATVHALVLASAGRPHAGLAVALRALVPHMPRYHRSMTAYADEIGARHP